MKIGDLKPKGSDKTFEEWIYTCQQSECEDCELFNECRKIGFWEMEAIDNVLGIEAEISDKYFDAVDRIKPCPNCRYQLIHDIENTKAEV